MIELEWGNVELSPGKAICTNYKTTGDRGHTRKTVQGSHKAFRKKPYLVPSEDHPLSRLVLEHRGRRNDMLARAAALANLEVGGCLELVNWRDLRTTLQLSTREFCRMLEEKAHFSMSLDRLNLVELKKRRLEANELLAFATVYRIDLNKLRPKEAA